MQYHSQSAVMHVHALLTAAPDTLIRRLEVQEYAVNTRLCVFNFPCQTPRYMQSPHALPGIFKILMGSNIYHLLHCKKYTMCLAVFLENI